MNINKLTLIDGVAGYEGPIKEYLINEIKVNNTEIDNLGNLYVEKLCEDLNKIMIVSHMDEVGLQVTNILKNGKIQCRALGSLKVNNLYMQRIKFRSGIIGIVVSNKDLNKIGLREVEAMQIDCGFKDYYDAQRYINIGEVGTFMSNIIVRDNIVISKALDNRVGCLVLLEIINNIKKIRKNITCVFTVQEEIGFKGAKIAADKVKPNIAIVIDTISVENIENIEIGEGVAIKCSDSMTVCDEKLVEHFCELAKENGINTQLEVSDNGGTELSVIQESNFGVKVIGLSIPIKYAHTANSIVDINDIESCIKLIKLFLEEE